MRLSQARSPCGPYRAADNVYTDEGILNPQRLYILYNHTAIQCGELFKAGF